MLHHQGGGPLYGAPPPEVGRFSPPQLASAPVPLSIHPPQQVPPPQPQTMIYDELAAAGAVNFPDDDALGDVGGVTSGGAGGSGAGGCGNRWPREETLALIRIRSEMDATFRGATLKGPLWEEVSRKLAELGYQRSAKKCKEKFENVDKYYKRTKEGRAGRQDGKSYRFFSQLEALHAAAPSPRPAANTAVTFPAFTGAVPASQPMAMPPPPGTFQPTPISAAVPLAPEEPVPPSVSLPGFSFSSLSDSDWDDESDDDEVMRETGVSQEGLGKRKRGGGDKKKVMAFFERMMKQVMEQQEAMQRRFLESLERREAERTAREEAWRRQEAARLNREQEQLAQERASAASRDAAVIAFLNRVGEQAVQFPLISVAATPTQMPAQTPPLQQKEKANREATMQRSAPPPAAASLELVPVQEPRADTALGGGGGESGGPSPSRWPKAEVHALIQMRVDLETRYHDAGPKGPLWEEISAGMRRMGYNRNAKRCKEKWENINKYYKKVKESNKKRPDDSKTCPYFHQLDAIYHRKLFGGGVVTSASEATASEHHTPSQREIEGKSRNDNAKKSNGGAESMQVVPSNGETAPAAAVFGDRAVQKLEDIERMLSEQRQQRELTTEETDSDGLGGDHTDDGEDSDDDGQMQYMVQFQTPNVGNSSNAPAPATAAAVPTSSPTSTFLGMVQ